MLRLLTNNLIEIGKIAGTHGVYGELKIEPWCDSPEFLTDFQEIYLGGETKPSSVVSARPHKRTVLMKIEGIDTIEKASVLRGTIIYIDRSGVELPPGRYFVKDLIGLAVYENSEHIGTLADVLTTPAHDVYIIRGLDGERMIPAVPEFIKDIDIDTGIIRVELIEGM